MVFLKARELGKIRVLYHRYIQNTSGMEEQKTYLSYSKGKFSFPVFRTEPVLSLQNYDRREGQIHISKDYPTS